MAEAPAVVDPPSEGEATEASSTAAAGEAEDFSAIERHSVVSLGGTDRQGRPVVVFYGCRLPPASQIDHQQLLRYLKKTLDQYVENDYTIVYFHHGLQSASRPSASWLLSAYRELDRKYKKNLKRLLIVHPTSFIKIIMAIFKPFISWKFGRKLSHVDRIELLRESLFVEQLAIPSEVSLYDKQLKPMRQSSAPVKADNKKFARTQQFGVPLSFIAEHNGGDPVSLVIQSCVSYVRENGLHTEGVLRRSGNKMDSLAAQEVFNQGKVPAMDDVHLASGLLKQFFRDLPEPVMTFNNYIRARGLISTPEPSQLSTCKAVISELPELNRRVLSYLLAFLTEVAEHEAENKMTAENLGIVFGPNLLWSDTEAASVEAMAGINFFATYLIDHREELGLVVEDQPAAVVAAEQDSTPLQESTEPATHNVDEVEREAKEEGESQ